MDIDPSKFWTLTFPNKSVIMSCNIAIGDYTISPPCEHFHTFGTLLLQAHCIPEYTLTLSSTALVLINLPYGLAPAKQIADPNHWDVQPFPACDIQ
jgi:hypothetical protein